MTVEFHDDNVFVINKESGPTSFEVVDAFRRATGIRKVGHTGTLDPIAEGVLLLCGGRATRAVEHFMDLTKDYEFVVRLGVETATLDREGEVVREAACPDFSVEQIRDAVTGFIGHYDMEPPAYSALKRNGRRLYELARAGEKATVEKRIVMIYEAELLEVELPDIHCRIRCSRGTYVRSLARDLGARLGVPAHVRHLVRTAIGPFKIEDAFPSGRLATKDTEGLRGIPVSKALSFLPGIVVTDASKRALFDGACPGRRDVVEVIGEAEQATALRILDRSGQLLAVGNRVVGDERPHLNWVQSYRLFVDRPVVNG